MFPVPPFREDVKGGGLGNATYQQLADERVRWTATGNLSRKEIVLTAAQKKYFQDIIDNAKHRMMNKKQVKQDREVSATHYSKSQKHKGGKHKNRMSKGKNHSTRRGGGHILKHRPGDIRDMQGSIGLRVRRVNLPQV